MHRVELKVPYLDKLRVFFAHVPNAPCGVESGLVSSWLHLL